MHPRAKMYWVKLMPIASFADMFGSGPTRIITIVVIGFLLGLVCAQKDSETKPSSIQFSGLSVLMAYFASYQIGIYSSLSMTSKPADNWKFSGQLQVGATICLAIGLIGSGLLIWWWRKKGKSFDGTEDNQFPLLQIRLISGFICIVLISGLRYT